MDNSFEKIKDIGSLQLQIHTYDCAIQQVICSGAISSLDIVSALGTIREMNRRLKSTLEIIKSF